MSIAGPGKALLSGLNLVKGYGAQPVLDGVSLTIHEGDRIGLIGRNGCGKSTLMRLLSGLDTPDGGEVTRAIGLQIALLGQACPAPRDWTIAEMLADATKARRMLLAQYEAALHALADGPPAGPEHERLQTACNDLQHQIEVHRAWDLEPETKRIAIDLALPDMTRTLGSLSGGELRRVDLAGKLLQHPDVLLLDEPTNHIDTRSVVWIERYLEQYAGSCVLVTHDRYFLDRVVNRIVEIEFKRILSFPGNYARFLEYKANLEETAARAEDNRQALLRRELEWLRRGPKARTTKQKARIRRYGEVEGEGPPARHREFEFAIPEMRPLGKTILEARKVHFGHADGDLIQDFSFIMQAEMRVGIIGPNGSGKTTLLRLLMGLEEPRKGKVVVGDSTDFLYVDQAHDDIVETQTVLEFVSGGLRHLDVGKRHIYVPAYLEKFLFDKHAVNVPMGTLSGGERNRLDLVRKLLRGGNVLVLDEPTNDLDLYTLRIVEELIEDFEGCALIVSHDRYFLNRVCTHMLVFEGDGRITPVVGNYDDYLLHLEQRRAEAGAARAAAAAAAAPAQSAAAAAASSRPARLTYKEREELAAMEERIHEAEAGAAALERAINDEGFYRRSTDEVQRTLRALDEARAQIEALYARWEALDAKRG